MYTVILNDAPYGSEKLYNGLRLASALQKKEKEVNVFLMADAVFSAMQNQDTPNGYYNIGRMIKHFLLKGGNISACITCLKARGIQIAHLIEGIREGNMDVLSDWCMQSEKVINY